MHKRKEGGKSKARQNTSKKRLNHIYRLMENKREKDRKTTVKVKINAIKMLLAE